MLKHLWSRSQYIYNHYFNDISIIDDGSHDTEIQDNTVTPVCYLSTPVYEEVLPAPINERRDYINTVKIQENTEVLTIIPKVCYSLAPVYAEEISPAGMKMERGNDIHTVNPEPMVTNVAPTASMYEDVIPALVVEEIKSVNTVNMNSPLPPKYEEILPVSVKNLKEGRLDNIGTDNPKTLALNPNVCYSSSIQLTNEREPALNSFENMNLASYTSIKEDK